MGIRVTPRARRRRAAKDRRILGTHVFLYASNPAGECFDLRHEKEIGQIIAGAYVAGVVECNVFQVIDCGCHVFWSEV
jgi:hypothetical protein